MRGTVPPIPPSQASRTAAWPGGRRSAARPRSRARSAARAASAVSSPAVPPRVRGSARCRCRASHFVTRQPGRVRLVLGSRPNSPKPSDWSANWSTLVSHVRRLQVHPGDHAGYVVIRLQPFPGRPAGPSTRATPAQSPTAPPQQRPCAASGLAADSLFPRTGCVGSSSQYRSSVPTRQ